MFGIGPGEFLVIIIVALLVLGPEKLPGAAKTLGRFMGQMRRMSAEFQRTLHSEIEPESEKQTQVGPQESLEYPGEQPGKVPEELPEQAAEHLAAADPEIPGGKPQDGDGDRA